jgi:hypothetical protein
MPPTEKFKLRTIPIFMREVEVIQTFITALAIPGCRRCPHPTRWTPRDIARMENFTVVDPVHHVCARKGVVAVHVFIRPGRVGSLAMVAQIGVHGAVDPYRVTPYVGIRVGGTNVTHEGTAVGDKLVRVSPCSPYV